MIWKFVTPVAVFLAWTTAALAHAQLVKSSPAADSALAATPSEVTLQFNEKLERAFSSVRVRDSSGQQVDKRDTQIEKGNPTIMRVSLPPLKAGSYTVQWRATATDLHKIDGTFSFKVGN
jgi:methionine-rich copper-binding protein CopC